MQEDNCFSVASLALVCDSYPAAFHPKELCDNKNNADLSFQLSDLD